MRVCKWNWKQHHNKKPAWSFILIMFYVYISLTLCHRQWEKSKQPARIRKASETTYAHTNTHTYNDIVVSCDWLFFQIWHCCYYLTSTRARCDERESIRSIFLQLKIVHRFLQSISVFSLLISFFLSLLLFFCLPLKTIKQRHIFYHT